MKTKIFLIFAVVAYLYSCGDDHLNKPRGSSDAVPSQILNPRVKNISGGSIIYYDRPDDKNLRYVKAVYTTDDGVEMDATASYFTDSLFIQGFKDACTVTVNLYSVSATEVMSPPVPVTISPQTPPYLVALENLEILPTFLGVRAATINETGAKLGIAMYKKNPATDRFEEIGLNFPNRLNTNINFSVKGQDTIENVYMVKIRDQWGHWSSEKIAAITPWYEEELNKKLFNEVRLCNIKEGDGTDLSEQQEGQILPSNYWGHFMHWWGGSDVKFIALWDGVYGRNTTTCYHTRPTGKLPQHFTIDLGKLYSLSRIIIWGRFADTQLGAGGNDFQHVYKNGFPKHIQLYGSTYTGNDSRELKDDIDNPEYWVDLGEYFLRRADGTMDMITDSGSAGTEEDRIQLQKGHEFEFPEGLPKVRYFRFRTYSVYNPAVNAVMIGEISLFGTDK